MSNPDASEPMSHTSHEISTKEVQDALASLYDLPTLRSHALTRILPLSLTSISADVGQGLQRCLLDAIEQLQPAASDGAQSERAIRRYNVFKLRYVEGLEIKEVCDRSGFGRAEYFRVLKSGTQAIADNLQSGYSASPDPIHLIMPTGVLTPLVGRGGEMELLKSAYTTMASGGMGRLIMIAGEQGIWKTRLAEEFGQWVE